jgi:VIT1/CCC1 family predicted Fe2+/Mn2+ transporter
MSTAPLEALVREQRLLIAALDADDVEAIARHTAAVEDALVRIRSFGARFTGAEARRLAVEAMTLTDAARIRVNVLADMTERRLTRLALATGKGNAAPTYGRTGRLAR